MPATTRRAREFTERTGIAAYKWDVADFDACQEGVAQGRGRTRPGRRAGQQCRHHPRRDHEAHGPEQWHDVIDTNLGGCFNMAKAVFDGMRERGFGRIVNIGSINGQAGQYGQVNYAAAKSGIHGFTKALAQEGARARASPSTPSRPAISTPTWSRAVPRGRAGEDRRQDPGRPARQGRARSPAACCSWSPRCRLHHRLDAVDQRRPAHVLTEIRKS